MYYINEPLIRNIYTLHNMSQKEFSTFAFGTDQFYPHRLCRFHLFTVLDIVKLANSTHIPIRHFFCENKDGKIYPSLSDIKINGKWKEITIDFARLQKISIGDGYEFSRQELLKFLNVDVSCFWRWVNTSFKMRAQMLCDMCNEFGIDLSDVINDQNEIIPTASTSKYTKKTKASLNRMRRRLEEQNKIIDEHKQHVEQLENERNEAIEEILKVKQSKTITKVVPGHIEDKWQWQSSQWQDDNIPTLSELIGYCNRQHLTTLPFLKNPNYNFAEKESEITNAAEDTTAYKAIITIDYMAYTMIAKSVGITDSPDTITIVKFCRILQENNLTPAFCINDPNAHYPITLPDRMARALGSAGITA